jgi:hypothetical protein
MYRGHPDFSTSYTTFLHLIQEKIPIAQSPYAWLVREHMTKVKDQQNYLYQIHAHLKLRASHLSLQGFDTG